MFFWKPVDLLVEYTESYCCRKLLWCCFLFLYSQYVYTRLCGCGDVSIELSVICFIHDFAISLSLI